MTRPTNRHTQRAAESQWRRGLASTWNAPRASTAATFLERAGFWIANHFVGLFVAALVAAYVAGVFTGMTCPRCFP